MAQAQNKADLSVNPGTSVSNKTGSWRSYRPVFNHEQCIGCGICEQVCPEGCTHNTGKVNAAGKSYREADLDYCKGCGICAEECPVKCIKMELEQK